MDLGELRTKGKEKDVMREIQKARIAVRTKWPFFANMIMYLEPQEAMWCLSNGHPTAATDGKYFYFHPDAIKRMKSNDELQILLCHEVLHCAFSHMFRRGARDPLPWNYAVDYVVNDILRQMGFKVPEGWLIDEQYKDKAVEHVYSLLMKDRDKLTKNMPDWLKKMVDKIVSDAMSGQSQQPQQGKGKKKSKSGITVNIHGLPSQPGQQGQQQQGQGSGAPGKKGKGSGPQSGQTIIDIHIDWSGPRPQQQFEAGQGAGANAENGQGRDEGKGKPVGGGEGWSGPNWADMTPEERAKRMQEWEMRLKQEVFKEQIRIQQGSRARGSLPGQFAEYIDELKKPNLDLKQHLAKYMKSAVYDMNNWSRLRTKRIATQNIPQPIKKRDALECVIVLDASGSVSSSDAGYFLGLVDDVLKVMPIAKLRYMEVDTSITKDLRLSRERTRSLSVLGVKGMFPEQKVQISGRGGTSFVHPFKRLEAEKANPKVLIYLTDGYGDFPEKPPGYKVFWVLNHRDTSVNPPFGEVARFDAHDIEKENERKQCRAASQQSSAGMTPSP